MKVRQKDRKTRQEISSSCDGITFLVQDFNELSDEVIELKRSGWQGRGSVKVRHEKADGSNISDSGTGTDSLRVKGQV